MNSDRPPWPAPLDLLPHGPEACCVDRILGFTPGRSVTAQWTVRDNNALYDPQRGGVPGWAGLEIMAQCAGLYFGLLRARRKVASHSPAVGYLVGTRRVDISQPLLPLEAELTIESVCAAADLENGDLGTFECRILCADKPYVAARLMLWCGETGQGKT